MALTSLFAACVWTGGSEPATPADGDGSASPASASGATDTPALAYRLDTGDRLRVIVFDEDDLSGEFEVDPTGSVSLPLIGQVVARGETPRSLEQAIEERLGDGYLKDPRVNVEVLGYRPFYIIGEVRNGGEYPFASGMHILNAVALAGGYTYRANTRKVIIVRDRDEVELPATADTRVLPGDVIRVPERFF